MVFGTTGPHDTATGRGLLCLSALLLAIGAAVPAAAQTSGCVLPLPVPPAGDIAVELQRTARGPGLLISWPDLRDEESTCAALVGVEGLGFPITIGGAYADDFDRRLRFQFATSGTVGDPARDRFVCAWNSLNSARTGRIGGEINLSNTGGAWLRGGDGVWRQRNAGLPISLPYTNLVDVAESPDGHLLACLTAGDPNNVDVNPAGLFLAAPGETWVELAPATFGRNVNVARVAMHPHDGTLFAAGTRNQGLLLTRDRGASFQAPAFTPAIPAQAEVTAVLWTGPQGGTRLYAAVLNVGLYVSADDGATFTLLPNLTVPDQSGTPVLPRLRRLAVSPANGDHLLAAATTTINPAVNGVYESLDAGQTWQFRGNAFIGLPEDGVANPAAPKTVLSLAFDPSDDRIMLMGTDTQGLWYTTVAGGAGTWHEATTSPVTRNPVWDIQVHDGRFYAQIRGSGLYESIDGGRSWTLVADQPFNRSGRRIVSTASGLLLATTAGGIFPTPAGDDPQAGTTFSISSTITNDSFITEAALRGLDFGLTLTFGAGSVTLTELNPDGSLRPRSFDLVLQDFQGWLVWRAEGNAPGDMAMIGRYDKTNPETCIEGYCGDDTYVLKPGCFAERLAACFDFSQPGRVSFYDENIFNGFTYYYAITPYDFGDLSLLADPVDLTSTLIYPSRFDGDPLGAVAGPGNRISYQVNVEAAPALDGNEIYVYPNPLRMGSGIAGGEGEQVVWTNLPPDSRIQVFTVAGDRIVELPQPGEFQQGGNIYWITRNHDNRLLASGIYLWRVIMPQRGDFWGKLVIIR